MPLVEWEERMKIGIEGLDEEHRQLIEMLNEMFDDAQGGASRDLLLMSLGRFIACMEAHFRTEESYLEKTGYPEMQEHKKEHDELIHGIRKAQAEYEAQFNVRLPPKLMGFLKDWFVDHVLNSDRKLVAHLSDSGIR